MAGFPLVPGVDENFNLPPAVRAKLVLSSEFIAKYISFSATAPDPTKAPIWADTSVTPPALKGWNGTAWVASTNTGTSATIDDTTLSTSKVWSSSKASARSVPLGGTTGQVLVKNSATDSDVKWGRQGISYARRSLAADGTLTSGSSTKLALGTVVADTDGYTTGLTGTDLFKIPQTGLYRVSIYFSAVTTATGGIELSPSVNNTAAIVCRLAMPVAATGDYGVSRSEILSLNANDVLTIVYYANTAGVTIRGGTGFTSMTVERVG